MCQEHTHDHDHEHHHHHHHHEEMTGELTEEQMAVKLLSYTLDHNEHHQEELTGLAAKLDACGKTEAAAKVREAAEAFERGNELLHKALHAAE